MVRITKVVTRAGDGGMTRLADGSEVSKDDPRVEAYGCVDELNAAMGLARSLLPRRSPLRKLISAEQNRLFDLGARIATADRVQLARRAPVGEDVVAALEACIERHLRGLPPLDSFVVPGSDPASAALHLARTVCRRAERACVRLNSALKSSRPKPHGGGRDDGAAKPRERGCDAGAVAAPCLDADVLPYLNRLGDLLFVLARVVAARTGAGEACWRPGAGSNRA